MKRKYVWYDDYIRTTDDTKLIWSHFFKDFIFQHRLRYIVYFRIAQNTKNKLVKLLCEYKLYRMSRKFGIEIKTRTKIGAGFVMNHPYNITVSDLAVIGNNVNIMKGATVGYACGKRRGAPVIGDKVYIGLNATVLGGITIGNDVLIAPNAFVNQDVPEHSIVIGNPAVIIPRENATAEYISYRRFINGLKLALGY